MSVASPTPSQIRLSQSQTDEANEQESFTMIILDFDDTLFPTTIRKCLNTTFGIDLFKLKKNKMKLMKQLQLHIVESLKTLTAQCNAKAHIALVSHASESWLKQMFSIHDQNDAQKHTKKGKIRLHILSKYFIENNVSIHCTTKETKNDHKFKGKKWLIKYKTIKSLIANKSQDLNQLCTQIISVGDGKYEKEALEKYSSRFGVRCAHYALIKAPSIHQLEQQWSLIMKTDILSLQCILAKKNLFIFDMNESFPNDNVDDCVGKTHQISSISTYFRYWLNENGKKADYSTSKKINCLAQKINAAAMTVKKAHKGSAFEIIVNVFCGIHPPLKKAMQNLGFESVQRENKLDW